MSSRSVVERGVKGVVIRLCEVLHTSVDEEGGEESVLS